MSKNETISEKIRRLEEGAEWFYSDEFVLDEAEKRYEELAKLAKEIEGELETLKNKVKIIAEDFTK